MTYLFTYHVTGYGHATGLGPMTTQGNITISSDTGLTGVLVDHVRELAVKTMVEQHPQYQWPGAGRVVITFVTPLEG